MARAIDADDFIKKLDLLGTHQYVLTKNQVKFLLMEQPTIDPVKHGYVSKEVLDQIRWERDIAMSYLEEAGIGFGEKAELQRVRHGKWNLVSRKNIWDDLVDVFECSECKKYTTNGRGNTSQTDFCPNCGARMDGE